MDLRCPPRLWNFFSGKPKYTSHQYPDDLDTTSLALIAMDYEPTRAHLILDEMLGNVDDDGLVQGHPTHSHFESTRTNSVFRSTLTNADQE